jgi:hypothetical protein
VSLAIALLLAGVVLALLNLIVTIFPSGSATLSWLPSSALSGLV